MKVVSFFVLVIFLSIGCSNPNSSEETRAKNICINIPLEDNAHNDPSDSPYLKLSTNQCNFGVIDKNEVSEVCFNVEFINAGEKPLNIFKADVSCGCVKVTYPNKIIPKASKDTIKVVINFDNQKGFINKVVYLKSNSKNDIELIRIKGTIK